MNGLLDLPTYLPNSNQNETNDTTKREPEQREDGNDSLVKNGDEPDDESIDTSKPVCIQGTSITLQTDEDIKQWIEERKKKWPTRKNIEAKQEQKHTEDQKRQLKRPSNEDDRVAKKPKQMCKFYQQNKSCRFGNKCKNMHERDSDYKIINNVKVKIPKLYENNYYTKENASEKSSLYKMLIKKDQFELENREFIKFLMHLDSQGLIKHDYDDIDETKTNDNNDT